MFARYSRGRLVLIGLSLLSLAGFAVMNLGGLRALGHALSTGLDEGDWLVLAGASALLLLGHLLRAARTKVPLDNVRRGTLAGQFRHLSIGYLFNVVWPLRVGEVARAYLIAKTLRISFLYTLMAIVLERLIDVVLIAVCYLALVALVGVPQGGVLALAVVSLVVAVALIVAFVLFVRENPLLMQIAWRLTGFLNTKLESRARFKLWSVIFGFQRFLRKRRQLARYAALALVSWVCYFGATLLVALAVLPDLGRRAASAATAAPFAVGSASLGNAAPESFLTGVSRFIDGVVALPAASLVQFGAAFWVVSNLPLLAVAVMALFVNWARRVSDPLAGLVVRPSDRYVNKLGREQDISQAFPHFLDSYFRGHRLSQVLHRLEVNGNVSLVRFFKGGSNAVTILAVRDGEMFVKKMVPLEYAHRLKNQYDWLVERAAHPELVTVLREVRADDHYAIDLEYRPQSVPLFDYVHENPFVDGAAKLDELWDYMYRDVYDLGSVEEHPELRDAYVAERLVERLRTAAATHHGLAEVMAAERITVNGHVFDNLDRVLERIRGTEQAWQDLASYRTSGSIHGDLTVDNVLVDLPSRDVLVIDPSDDNQIRGPVIDFARHMQSLLYGYEFLNEDETPVVLGSRDGLPEIVYRNNRSARYSELADHVVSTIMPRHLTPGEQRAVLFHVGLFYGRMLTHRVVINPDNALKYYGVCIQALNRFIEQYDLPVRDDRQDDIFGLQPRHQEKVDAWTS